jgi:CheY-like chemotaxis protein
MRALIVDDNEVNRRVIEQQIAGWGLRYGSCASGEEALSVLKAARLEDPYRIAIIDYLMPGMDGGALAARIKDDPSLSDIVIVMLTSVSEGRGERQGARCEAYLVKPVRQTQLLRTIATAWNQRMCATVAALPAAAAPHAPLGVKTPGHGIRVLIAEDNLINQRVGLRLLERLGLTADVAANGREAVELFKKLPYDLILMDCQMPEMDGYEASREIRRREPSGHHTLIVAMTARAMAGAREHCLDAGMDDYISKPVRLEDLSQVLDRCLSADKAHPGVEQPV